MKILWLKNNLLHPLDSGGRIRSYQILRQINGKHEVHYAAFADERWDTEAMRLASEYCRRLFTVEPPRVPEKNTPGYYARVFGGLIDAEPFTVSSYRNSEMRSLVERLIAANGYDILVADFLAMCLNVPDVPAIPVVHFSHNVEAMIWKRHGDNETNAFKRFVFRREQKRIERFERKIVTTYAFTIAVSEKDCEHFRRVYGGTRAGSVATGVDTGYFTPRGGPEDPNSIIFLGSMDWMPNIDAIHHFVRNIYPLIKNEVPAAKLSVVGRNPDVSVRALQERDPSITVTGTVSDTRDYIDRAAVAVVPLRIGGGTRVKIYEMMAMAKTIVSTTIGAEGLNYSDGKNILIADESERFARLVIEALRDSSRRGAIGNGARDFVVSHCSWEAVADEFVHLLDRARKGCGS